MLKQRVITALILFLVVSGVLFFASTPIFCIFVGMVLSVAAWEWANLCDIKVFWQRCVYALGTVTIGLVGWWLIDHQRIHFLTVQSVLMVSAAWWAVALLWVQGYPGSSVLWSYKPVLMIMGFLVMLPTWLGMSILHSLPNGLYLVLAVVIVVATADSGAYFAGKAFGKRKLAPKVSPGKSWEGVLGGFLAVSILGSVFCLVNGRQDLGTVLGIILPTALVSVLGDLLESMLKRHRGIKDSSQLLPGHGGVLDRVDGLAAAVPIFALAILLSGWQW